MLIKHIWLLALALAAAASLGAGNARSATLLETQQLARQPAPKLVCKTGTVVFKNGRVKATGGCTFKGRSVGKWSWSNPTITDATGTSCTPLTPASGFGSSFEPKPAARVTPVFTLRVPKTRFYRAKVLRVGGRTLIAGWDSCGTPLEIISLPPGTSPLCVYVTDHGFDLATRTLRLATLGCPIEFGACKWVPVPPEKWYSPAMGVTVYGGMAQCENGNVAITNALLNSGCIPVIATGAFVLPPSWGGNAYWDINLLTADANWQPLPMNVIPPGEWGYGDASFNGYTPYQRLGPFTLSGTKPFC